MITVSDTIAAEIDLEPLTCIHCKKTGNVTFMQSVGDAHCADCGEWQQGDDNEPAPFNWTRWHRVHRAACRRFDRHAAAGVPVRTRWARYDQLMSFTRAFLERVTKAASPKDSR